MRHVLRSGVVLIMRGRAWWVALCEGLVWPMLVGVLPIVLVLRFIHEG